MQPRHIAVIPDGNRRWARRHGLSTMEGHRVAAEKILPDLVQKASDMHIAYFTFWAMSTENFVKRGDSEVNNLLGLLRFFLDKKLKEFGKKGIRIETIGNLNRFSKSLQKLVIHAKEETKNNTKITLILALNYGGRDEIVRAVKRIKDRQIQISTFGTYLDTKDIPDPDLIIRTGGERRLSGFMLWQSEYSELYFSDKLFPDFTPDMLEAAVEDFVNRKRRFGK